MKRAIFAAVLAISAAITAGAAMALPAAGQDQICYSATTGQQVQCAQVPQTLPVTGGAYHH